MRERIDLMLKLNKKYFYYYRIGVLEMQYRKQKKPKEEVYQGRFWEKCLKEILISIIRTEEIVE